MTRRRSLVNANAGPSMRRQCEVLGVNRSSLYYDPVEPDAEELALMRRMDELHLQHPFFGSRMMTRTLNADGVGVNRKRVQRLMRVMGLESTTPKPITSTPAPEHAVYPYWLRHLTVSRINEVWAADITYIPMARGFVFLMAIVDWYSRRVLAWGLSTTLETSFCVEALRDALARYNGPEIFNTDQGAQFTAEDFTDVLLERTIKISMDGKGRFIDNIFVERFWRSLKYEEVYLYAYDTVPEARAGIARYVTFFNDQRPHHALGSQTPASFYDGLLVQVLEHHAVNCEEHLIPQRLVRHMWHVPEASLGRLRTILLRRSQPGRLHLSSTLFWSEEWGPLHPTIAIRKRMGTVVILLFTSFATTKASEPVTHPKPDNSSSGCSNPSPRRARTIKLISPPVWTSCSRPWTGRASRGSIRTRRFVRPGHTAMKVAVGVIPKSVAMPSPQRPHR